MSLLLTEEQELIGQSARDFAKEHLDPIAVELDHTGTYPAGLIKTLAAQDFLGLFVEGAYGGAEAGFVSLVAVVENLSRSCPAVASIVVGHSLAAYALQRWGSAAQKRAHLPGLAKGEVLGAFAANGDLRASQVPEGWLLDGTLAYVRNAGVAGLYVVAAGSSVFLVAGRASGLTVGALADTMGLKGCPVADLTFDHVILKEDALLGADGAALVAETLAVGTLAEAAQTLGIGQAAVEHAAAYAKTRIQFGRPIASLQAIQTLLAETATDVHLARLAVDYAANLLDQGQPFQVEAAMAKQFLARFGAKMLVDTVQVEGGFGYSEFMPLPRLFRDIAGTTLLDAPADLPETTIAAALLA